MKQILAGFLLICSVTLFAQQNPAMGKRDTIKYAYRTGGEMATIDLLNSYMSTTMPGGPFTSNENILPYNFFVNSLGGVKKYSFNRWNNMRFSGIPHLGFGYQFGSQATQYVNVRYTHAFTPQLLLNIDYDMGKANGFYRNSTAANHDVQVRLQRQAAFYSFNLKAQYMGRNAQYNDGLINDSLIASYALGFIPVNKQDARAQVKGARVELEHYCDFLKSDSINATGVYVDNTLRVVNRRYRESGDNLEGLYGPAYFSADSISDQHQLSELTTGAGLYYNRPNFFIKAGLDHNYWKYANLGQGLTQNEINANAKLNFVSKNLELINHSNFNLVGANREWFTHANVIVQLKKFSVNGRVAIDNLLPEPFQRSFRGNFIGYNYVLGDLKNQWKTQVDGSIKWKGKSMNATANTGFAGMKNVYWFENGAWSQQNNSIYNGFTVGLDYQAKFFNWFNVGAKAMYSSAEWMPDLFGRLRLSAGGKILKNKKLYGQFGVEGSYSTAYNLIAFSPMFESYRYEQGLGVSRARLNAHVFGALEIQTFRFFFRVENLGTLFNEKTIEVMNGYVIAPIHFRIGITWDFFN